MNTADEAQVKAKRKTYAQEQLDEDNAFKTELSTESGRRVLWTILEHCSVFKSIWAPGEAIHHNAGRQDVGHWLIERIETANPDALLVMMHEAQKRKTTKDTKDTNG